MTNRSKTTRARAGRLAATAAAALAAAAVAAGCGEDEPEPEASGPETEQAETAETGGTVLDEIRATLEDAGYEIDPTKPAKGGDAERLGSTEGLTVFKGDLIAEIFSFPSEADAQEYTESFTGGEPSTVVGALVYAGAVDDSQADIDQLVEDSGQ